MAMGSYLSIITLNVNGLNVPNKRQILAVWIQKPLYVLSTRDTPQTKGYIQTETEGLGKDISCKWRPKEKRSSNTHVRQIGFKIKALKRDKEGHYIMIKGSIQEDITIINIYAPNIGAAQYVRQMLSSMKGETNSNIIRVGTLIPTHTYGQINQT